MKTGCERSGGDGNIQIGNERSRRDVGKCSGHAHARIGIEEVFETVDILCRGEPRPTQRYQQ